MLEPPVIPADITPSDRDAALETLRLALLVMLDNDQA